MSNTVGDLSRHELFPTLVWACHLKNFADHDRKMLQYVLDLYEREPNLENHSNMIGWHSHIGLHQEPIFMPLTQQVEAIIHNQVAQDLKLDLAQERYRVKSMWAIVSPTYAFNQQHRHPFSLFSGVYYLQIPPGSGVLKFHDPRSEIRMLGPRFAPDSPFRNFSARFEPVANRLLLFPAWLPHSVEPNLGEQPRIAISFNIEGYQGKDLD